jgi:hypothetical protein
MIYISEKNENEGDVIVSYLEEFGINKIKIITDSVADDQKFTKEDVIIFVSRESLASAMLTKNYCRETKVLLVSSLIDGGENKLIGCSGLLS